MDDDRIIVIYGDSFKNDSPRTRQLEAQAAVERALGKPTLWQRIKRWFR